MRLQKTKEIEKDAFHVSCNVCLLLTSVLQGGSCRIDFCSVLPQNKHFLFLSSTSIAYNCLSEQNTESLGCVTKSCIVLIADGGKTWYLAASSGVAYNCRHSKTLMNLVSFMNAVTACQLLYYVSKTQHSMYLYILKGLWIRDSSQKEFTEI